MHPQSTSATPKRRSPRPRVTRICETCGVSFSVTQWATDRGFGRFCSKPCKGAGLREPLDTRFWRHVERADDPDACWLWTGAAGPLGYGRFFIARRANGSHETAIAPRIAWQLHHGYPPPTDRVVRHRCDTPRCVNPHHLLLGTHKDNTQDAVRRGRMPCGDQHYTRRHPEHTLRGERNPTARLSDETARQALILAATAMSQHDIALRYGVSDSAISHLVAGKTWRHLSRET